MQVTSYLMMGALSPGLKRHSVTLFEGDFCQCPIPQPACLSAAAILPPSSASRPSYLWHSCSCQGKTSKVPLASWGNPPSHVLNVVGTRCGPLRCMLRMAGGRVTGAEVISELITELDASVEAAAGFEGEMQRLSGYARCAIVTTNLRLESQSLYGATLPAEACRHKLWPQLLATPAAALGTHCPRLKCCVWGTFVVSPR